MDSDPWGDMGAAPHGPVPCGDRAEPIQRASTWLRLRICVSSAPFGQGTEGWRPEILKQKEPKNLSPQAFGFFSSFLSFFSSPFFL